MATPEFILDLREKVGHAPLWLSGCKAVVLRDDDREVLLVRRADNGSWTLPAGIIDPGEEPAETAVREVAEETCVQCVPRRLAGVGTTHEVAYPNGDRVQYLDVVMVMDAVAGEAAVGDEENLEVAWFAVDEVPQMPELHARGLRWGLEAGPARFVHDGRERP